MRGIVLLIALTLNLECVQSQQSIDMEKRSIDIGVRLLDVIFMNHNEMSRAIQGMEAFPDSSLSAIVGASVFVLSDNRVVALDQSGNGALYASIKDLQDLMQFLSARAKSHPFEGIPYTVNNFFESMERICNHLFEDLCIDTSRMDYSLASIKIVDQAIHESGMNEFQFEDSVFVKVIAYSAMVISKELKGSMSYIWIDESNGVFEPIVKDERGREYSPLWPVFNEINDNFQQISIHSALEEELNKYRLQDYLQSR